LKSFQFFLWYRALNSGPTPWTTLALFYDRFFQDRVSWTICLGWLWTMILLISASWVARITDVSHRHPALFQIWVNLRINIPSFVSKISLTLHSHFLIEDLGGLWLSPCVYHTSLLMTLELEDVTDWDVC
jgi:hypothetical protein